MLWQISKSNVTIYTEGTDNYLETVCKVLIIENVEVLICGVPSIIQQATEIKC